MRHGQQRNKYMVRSFPINFVSIYFQVSPTHNHVVGTGEQRQHTHTVLSSPPRGTVSLRKPRGEGKKCRKVYGMENRDMWCTACRWKKACQRFIDWEVLQQPWAPCPHRSSIHLPPQVLERAFLLSKNHLKPRKSTSGNLGGITAKRKAATLTALTENPIQSSYD